MQNFTFTRRTDDYHEMPESVFSMNRISRDFPYLYYINIDSRHCEPKFKEVLIQSENEQGTTWEAIGLVHDGAMARIVAATQAGKFYVTVAGYTREAAVEAGNEVKTWCTPKEHLEDGKVSLDFWALSTHGPRSYRRDIVAPTWEEIQPNYSKKVRDDLERIVSRSFDPEEGKLVIWHGPPGTGKTFAIRALIRSWLKTASVDYIIDPEKFFSTSPDYMLQIILNDSRNHLFDDGIAEELDEAPKDDHLKLLILEDTGEMLHSDAQDRIGQGLGRLLNVVDGLIGQGLNLVVLLTTNEEISSFHEAVIRPGRCLGLTKFDTLSVAESNAWLASHNCDKRVTEAKSLAELYMLLHDGQQREEQAIATGMYV